MAVSAEPSAAERLGTASFSVSCSPASRVPFSRGVALLHDFWYEEARRQFEQIAKADPKSPCGWRPHRPRALLTGLTLEGDSQG